jgi:hypothetical protein
MQAIAKKMEGLRTFRSTMLPRAIAATAASEQQQRVLGQLQTLLDELFAAYEQKRDPRPVVTFLDGANKAFEKARASGEWGPVEARIRTMRAAVKTLPQLPPVGTGTPPAGTPGSAPPALPPAAPPAQPASPAEGILRMIDVIRAMPEDRYQAEKPKIGAGIAQMLAAVNRAGAPGTPSAPGEPVGRDLQVLLSPKGEVLGLQVLGEALAAPGQEPGGISVQLDGAPELPIRAPVTRQGEARQIRVENPQGAVSVLLSPGANDLTLKVAGRRAKAGGPATLNLSVPVRLGGWYWQSGPDQQTIALDHDYRLRATDGKLPKLVLAGAAAQVTVDAPTAGEVAYLPAEGRLLIRLPLTLEAGSIEHTVRLSAMKRVSEKK